MKTEWKDPEDVEPEIRKKLNAFARLHGSGKCTRCKIDTQIDTFLITRQETYGFTTFSGKFFPRVKTTKYWHSGYYTHAVCHICYNPKNI